MEIRQQFTVAHDPATVWQSLGNVRLVASCLPGAEVTAVSDDGRDVSGRIKARVGPIGASFAGSARHTRDDATMKGTLEGSGVDEKNGSRTTVKMTYAVEPAEDGRAATVKTVASVTLAGLLAQFGKGGIINDVATQIAREFANRLQAALATAPTPAPSSAGEPVAAPPVAPTPGEDLRPLQIIWGMIVARVRRLFGASP